MRPLTPLIIARAKSDDALQERLGQELTRVIGGSPDSTHLGAFVRAIRTLPTGLRAMAATYELDVSMALDSLEDHFRNWHSQALAYETLRGLRVLGAGREAEVFGEALLLARQNWSYLRSSTPARGTSLFKAFKPLNTRLWRLLGYQGDTGRSLLALWAPYAREYPETVCGPAPNPALQRTRFARR